MGREPPPQGIGDQRDTGPAGPVIGAVERLVDGLARLAAGLAALIALALLAIVAYGVVMRYLFVAPQVWTDETATFLLVLMVMLGLAEVLRRDEHIAVDLVTSRLGPRGRRLVGIWSMLAVLAVSGVLFASAWKMVAFSSMVGLVSSGHMEVPMWIPQASLLLGMALLMLAAANRLLRLLLHVADAPED